MIKKVFVPDVVLHNIIIDAFMKTFRLQQALKLYPTTGAEIYKLLLLLHPTLGGEICRLQLKCLE
jgi:hypothetical protein